MNEQDLLTWLHSQGWQVEFSWLGSYQVRATKADTTKLLVVCKFASTRLDALKAVVECVREYY